MIRTLKAKYGDEYEETALLSKLMAYCSKEAHSCVEKAAMIGFVKLRILEPDQNCRYFILLSFLFIRIIQYKKLPLTNSKLAFYLLNGIPFLVSKVSSTYYSFNYVTASEDTFCDKPWKRTSKTAFIHFLFPRLQERRDVVHSITCKKLVRKVPYVFFGVIVTNSCILQIFLSAIRVTNLKHLVDPYEFYQICKLVAILFTNKS